LPDQPDGWVCTFFYDEAEPLNSVFLCNRIKDPSIAKEFRVSDPDFKNAHCMDLNTFKDYSGYVFKIQEELLQCRNGGVK